MKKRPRVPGMNRERAKTAPYHSCVSCFKGDTDTGFAVYGEAEWHLVMAQKLTGMDEEEATRTLLRSFEDTRGTDPGMVPAGEFLHSVRMCADCAAEHGAQVGPLNGEIPLYAQPPELTRLDDMAPRDLLPPDGETRRRITGDLTDKGGDDESTTNGEDDGDERV
jgi:hypothetical protein